MISSHDDDLDKALRAFQQGDLKTAETTAREVLHRIPGQPQALHLLALVAYRMGNFIPAAQITRDLTALYPENAEFHYNLGLILQRSGDFRESESAYRRALDLRPDWADAHYNLSLLLRNQGRIREAVAGYRRAIELRPGHVESHNNLGEALLELGESEEARACFSRALQLRPDFAKVHNNLGKVLSLEKRYGEAIPHFKRAIELDPGSALAYTNLGLAMQSMGEGEEASRAYERALAERPGYLTARWNLCMSRLPVIYRTQEEVGLARESYRLGLDDLEIACTLDSPQAVAEAVEAVGSTQPFYLAYQGEVDKELQSRYGSLVARIMAARYPGKAISPAARRIMPVEPIRVGFLSRWFVRHSVWKIPIRGWVEGLDRGCFRLYAYHTGPERDSQTVEAERLFDRFHQGPCSLDDWIRRIRTDAPHFLIFPEVGMDPLTVKLAALRLAPVQCATWGHPDTTGLPTIDYFISSDLMEPAGAESHYTERLVRLPNLSIAYAPLPVPQTNLERKDLGLPCDTVLYWCCQSLYKYLPRYDEVFPRIAREVPACRFVFIRYADGERVNEIFQERLDRAFAAFGLSSRQFCIMLGRLDAARFDAAAILCDVFLDSIGWSGCNTTLEAITHDLPIVTLPGRTMRSRHTAAMLERMGITHYIAGSLEEYVTLAAGLGLDPDRRRAAREEIAARKHLLYNDNSCIDALAHFLSEVARA